MKEIYTLGLTGLLALSTGCTSQKTVSTPEPTRKLTHECFWEMAETIRKFYNSEGNVITGVRVVEGLRPEGKYILEYELDLDGDGVPDRTLRTDFACDYDFGNLTHGMLEVDGKLEGIWNPEKSRWEAPKEQKPKEQNQ